MILRKWMPLWAVAVLIVLSVGTVWLRLAIVRTSYDINQADHQIRELQLAREYATVRYTGLRSPRRLELLARTRFGLSQPRQDQIIRMDGMSATSEPGKAKIAVKAGTPPKKTAAKKKPSKDKKTKGTRHAR